MAYLFSDIFNRKKKKKKKKSTCIIRQARVNTYSLFFFKTFPSFTFIAKVGHIYMGVRTIVHNIILGICPNMILVSPGDIMSISASGNKVPLFIYD